MVYLDHHRRVLEIAVSSAEESVRDANWDLFCYDHAELLFRNKLAAGKDYHFGTGENILVSDSPLEKCVFDGSKLQVISPIVGGSHRKDSALYRCKKCKVKYSLPLNAKDKKAHDKRMREMVFEQFFI